MAAHKAKTAKTVKKAKPPSGKAQSSKAPAAHRATAHVAKPEAHLSARPTWQGHLRLSLVSCPVALYGATTRTNDISFHLLNPETNNRIRMIPTDPDTGPIERSELVKGYEVEKNRYIIIDNEDLKSVKLETTKTIDIDRFVAADEIDRLYWNDPYFLLPDGKTGTEAYAVIRAALEEEDRIAIGRVVMHTRERMVAIEPRDNGLLVYTLRTNAEVVSPREAFDDISTAKPDARMVDIARKIIEQQEGPFEPSEFEDRYEKALRELIRRKERGEKPVKSEPVEDTNVVDLMEALKKSLKNKGQAAPARAPANSNKRKSAR
jgi:DNA end-binding protein Ku